MRDSLIDMKDRFWAAVRGMAMLALSLISFIVALWVLMALVRLLIPAG